MSKFAPEFAPIREALLSTDGRIALVPTLTHGLGVQVYRKGRKIGPIILPAEGESVADVLSMLGALVIEGGE